MEFINGSNAQSEIVALLCKTKDGSPSDATVRISHAGQEFVLSAGKAARLPRAKAVFFVAKSKRWDVTNPLTLEIVEEKAASSEAAGTTDDAERESLIQAVVESGAMGRREAKKLSTDELKALLS